MSKAARETRSPPTAEQRAGGVKQHGKQHCVLGVLACELTSALLAIRMLKSVHVVKSEDDCTIARLHIITLRIPPVREFPKRSHAGLKCHWISKAIQTFGPVANPQLSQVMSPSTY